MTKTHEICNRCGCEPAKGCVNGSVEVNAGAWAGCDNHRRIEFEVWKAKVSVDGHHILAWEEIYQVTKVGTKTHFVFSRSAELGYTILRTLPRGKIRAVPTSRLHPKKKEKSSP